MERPTYYYVENVYNVCVELVRKTQYQIPLFFIIIYIVSNVQNVCFNNYLVIFARPIINVCVCLMVDQMILYECVH